MLHLLRKEEKIEVCSLPNDTQDAISLSSRDECEGNKNKRYDTSIAAAHAFFPLPCIIYVMCAVSATDSDNT